MFFMIKSVFWRSVVALMMPDADVEARRAVAAGARQIAAAAPAAMAAMAAQDFGAADVGAKCVATAHCRVVLTELIRAALAEDAAPDLAPPAKAPIVKPAAKSARAS